MQAIRTAQALADDPPNIYLSSLCIDFDMNAGDHYAKSGYDTMGARMANAVLRHLGDVDHHRGPTVTSATFAGGRATVDVTLMHRGGADIAPASGITGFSVLDDGNEVTINAATRKDATTVRLQLQTAVQGVGTLRYLYGKFPDITALVVDDSPLALPLEPTTAALTIGE